MGNHRIIPSHSNLAEATINKKKNAPALAYHRLLPTVWFTVPSEAHALAVVLKVSACSLTEGLYFGISTQI